MLHYSSQHTAEGAYGLVVDVAVTGVKKTVTIRSALQVRTTCICDYIT